MNGMTPHLLQLRNLSVDIATPRGEAKILRNLDLVLERGERLGIVGESGSGKSMMALAIMGLLPDAATAKGAIGLSGEDLLTAGEDRMCALRGRRVAMVFQEPMSALNPVLRIGDQVAEGPVLHLGLGRQEALERAKKLLGRVGLPPERFSPDLYPHQLSGGQRQRVVVAIALACEPALLIADEPTTALDATIQTGILDLIVDLTRERDMGLIMISHDLGVIGRTTERVAVMYAGRFVETGETSRLLREMAHPYSRGLYRAMPQHAERSDRPARHRPRLPTMPGAMPDPHRPIRGCAFSSRCGHADDVCRTTLPPLAGIGPSHHVACHYPQGEHRLLEAVH